MHLHYTEDIKILRDDLRERSKQPNKLNIKHGLDWLMEGAGPGSSLFFYFSGKCLSIDKYIQLNFTARQLFL